MAEDFDTSKTKVMADLEREMFEQIEQRRAGFYYMRYTYMLDRKGGERYNAILNTEGQAEADSRAQNVEERFTEFLKEAHLTADGETTIAEIPTDRMLAGELRRIRGSVNMSVFDFMTRFRRWIMAVPEISRHTLELALAPFQIEYVNLYLQFHMLIDVDLVQAMPPWAVDEFIAQCAARHGAMEYRIGPLESKATRNAEYDKLTLAITNELRDFLLGHIPTRIEELETRKLRAMKPVEAPKLLH